MAARTPDLCLRLSAADAPGLQALARRLRVGLVSGQLPLASGDIGEGPVRAAIVGRDLTDLTEALDALAAGQEHPAVAQGTRLETPRVGFLLTGEGSERAGAGAGLVAAHPAFAARVRSLLGSVGRDELADLSVGLDCWHARHESKLLLGALELGLVGLLADEGLTPSAVVGHSVGEYVAAAACGVLSHDDAMSLLDDLGRGLAALNTEGGLLLVRGERDVVEGALHGLAECWVAVDNAERWVGVSGTTAGLVTAREALSAVGLLTRSLRVGQPVHGPALATLAPTLAERAGRVTHRAPNCVWLSTVTGEAIAGADAAHWARALVSSVRFREAWAAAAALPVDLWVDLGPKAGLSLFTEGTTRVIAALDPRLDDASAWTRLLGWLWCHGALEHTTQTAIPLDAVPLSLTAEEEADTRRPEDHIATWAQMSATEQVDRLLSWVQRDVATVLRLTGPSAVAPDRPLLELGLDSLMAVELRNRLSQRSALALPAMLAFDSPTPHAIALELQRRLFGPGGGHTALDLWAPSADQPWTAVASPGQRRLVFLDGVLQRGEVYNTHIPLQIEASLDPDALQRAMNALIARHEQLRVSFEMEDGEVVQRVHPWVDLPLQVHDLGALGDAEQTQRLEHLSTQQSLSPFVLSHPPLLRWSLVLLAPTRSVLLITWHHAVTDGWSLSVLLRDLVAAYQASCAGRDIPTAPTISYARYSAYRQRLRETQALDPHRRFWREALAGVSPLELPLDRPTPSVPSHRGGMITFTLPEVTSAAIDALARREGVTPFVVLLGAWATLLSRLSGQSAFVVTTASAGRPRPELEEVIGFFVNTLPIPCDLTDDPTVSALLKRLRERVEGALRHEELSLEEILRESPHPRRGATQHPLASVSFVLQDERWLPSSFGDVAVKGLGRSLSADVEGTAKFDLSLAMARQRGRYQASLEYACDVLDEQTVTRWAGAFEVLLTAWVEPSAHVLSTLPILTPHERQTLLVDWNNTAAPVPELPVHALVEAQVQRAPDAVAVVFEEESLSYGELNAAANRLAWRLKALGVGPEVRVGIGLARGLNMVVAVLGVLKAGGAYVPLDPSYPEARLRFMAEDAGLSVLVTTSDLTWLVPQGVVRVDLDTVDLSGESAEDPPWTGTAETLAYVIYTSGSTGRPKGVAVAHRGLPNMIGNEVRSLGLSERSHVLSYASPSFDASVPQLFAPLAAGGRIVVASDHERGDVGALVTLIHRRGVDVTELPPAMAPLLDERSLESIKVLMFSGEACNTSAAAKLSSRCRVVNAYGPTEASVTASYWEGRIVDLHERVLPIGRPIPNTRLYVLDAYGAVVPLGVPGELHIGGLGLARGYLGRPGLTAERFVPDPFGRPGGRLYRTGDRCRWRADGDLEFLGRIDHQVKIRGFRVELGEIEAALLALPGVRSAVVVARDDGPGGARLVAYVVGDEAQTDETLRAALHQRLPEWMLPSAFVFLDKLPLNPSGKVDRKALPAPDREVSTAYVAPRTATEAALAAIWAEVLGVERVGLHDNFFALGGDSILSIQVVSRAARAGIVMAVRDLFAHPNVAALAAFLSTGLVVGGSGCLVRLRAGDGERPLVCFSPLGGAFHIFHSVARALRPGLPIWVFEAPEVAGLDGDYPTVTALAERHVGELLPLLSVLGAARLAGYSWGGMVAVEVARLLRERGVAVETVLILDGGAPSPEASTDEERVELGFLARQQAVHLDGFVTLDLEDKIRVLADSLRGSGEPASAPTWEEHLRRIVRAVRANRRRSTGWSATAPGVPVTLIVAEESARQQPDLGWGPILGDALHRVQMPGDHQGIVLPPLVNVLARHIEDALGPAPSAEAPWRLLPGRQRVYRSELTDSTRWDHLRRRPGDVFVCTMAKHGTTWTQTLVAMLLHGGPALPWPIAEGSPWFDAEEGPIAETVARLEAQTGRRVLKTHTPLDGVPHFDDCVYIGVYRDPRDAFFSRADHAENMKEAERANMRRVRDPDADFREWVDAPWPLGLQGAFSLDETLHHLRCFTALRHLPNVHLFHYAELKRDLPAALDRLASALGVPLTPDTRAAITAAADLGAMRSDAARFAPGGDQGWHEVSRFFAQGRLGGWRGKLSEDSLSRFHRRLHDALGPEWAQWLVNGYPNL